MKSNLVIAGAKYYDNGEIYRPHFTGEYSLVDADRYITEEAFIEEFGKEEFDNAEENGDKVYHNGEWYYNTENYIVWSTDSEDIELVSDLANLRFTEE